MTFLYGKSILITGGTGSFGKSFIKHALDKLEPSRIAVLSRDELKQYELRTQLNEDPRVRWFIGDVRDRSRLDRAFSGVDVVIHAAAMKQVDTAEYNPFECIATNVMGAENVINAAIDAGVERVVALSTDKASSPINLYGASKLCSDKLFVAGNNYSGYAATRFAVVRYGNVMGSRGSVLPVFQGLAATGKIPITDDRMTRFWITLPQAIQFVVDAFDRMYGGEIFVPRIPSATILDVAKAVAPNATLETIGIRPGEKLHEEMISQNDSRRTYEFDDYYVIAPILESWLTSPTFVSGKLVPEGFSYCSNTNDQWLSVEQIRQLANTPT